MTTSALNIHARKIVGTAIIGALLIGCKPLSADNQQPRSHKTHTADKDGPSRKRLAACEAVTRQEYRKALEGEEEEEEKEGVRRIKKTCRGVSKRKQKEIMVKIILDETPTLPTSTPSE